MEMAQARLDGVLVLQPAVHEDERGFFQETYRRELHEWLSLAKGTEFVQDNHSRSHRGVVRGMHFHVGRGAAKLVRCARGSVLDVVIDLRRGSPTFGEWEGFELDDERHRELFVPVGFAHGFCALSEVADVLYKQTAYYDPSIERAIAYDDPDIGIEWPAVSELIVSPRDAAAPQLRELAAELPF